MCIFSCQTDQHLELSFSDVEYDMYENRENPPRCPVKLYKFYLSKCPESVKNKNNMFYLQPEESCEPDSPLWYSDKRVSRSALEDILSRQLNERTPASPTSPASPASYGDPDETESSDEAADAKKMKDSVIHTSVNFKEGESLIDVRRRLGKQLKKDFILFDFWYADHEVEDGKTMKDFDIFHKSAKIRLEIQENSSGGRLNIEGFYENLFVGESESEDEAVVQEQEAEEEDHNHLEEEDAVQDEEDETKLQEIDRKITEKLEEIAKNHQELDALHKERMKISGKMRRDGQGGGSKKKQRTAVVQEAEEEEHNHLEEEDAVQDEEDGKVKVFCAGFCFDNGKPEARAGVGVYWGDTDARNKSCRVSGIKQTIRTAEVQAATMAITEAIRNTICDLQVNTDKFVYTSVTKDMKRWKQKGWKTARGKDLQNKNDWQELDRQLKRAEENNVNIEWKLWKGEGKDEANNLASEGARLYN